MYSFNTFPLGLSEQEMNDLSDNYHQPNETGLPMQDNSVFSAALQGISRLEHDETRIHSESAYQAPGSATA